MTKQDNACCDASGPRAQGNDRMPPFFLLGRMAAYVLALACMVQLLLTSAASDDYVELFREGEMVEWFQQFLIVGCSALLGIAAWVNRELRPMMLILSALAAVAAIRELDSLFGRMIPLLGWQLPAGMLVLFVIIVLVRHRATMGRQINTYVRTLSAGIIWCGFVEVVIFAQIMGQAEKWRPLLGESYTRHLKRVIEESSETFGYMLLFFGAIEALAWALCMRKSRQAAIGTSEVVGVDESPALEHRQQAEVEQDGQPRPGGNRHHP